MVERCFEAEMRRHLEVFGPEELHPELAQNLTEIDGLGMPALKHPLIYSVPYMPPLNKMLNAGFAQKKRELADCLLNANLNKAVFLHERPYRLDAFKDWVGLIGSRVPNGVYWETVRQVWTDSENVHECWDDWLLVWRGDFERHRLRDRRMATSLKDRRDLDKMPETLKVWHGEEHPERIGMSWTLSRDIAAWFARRFGKKGGKLYEGKVARSDVIAYMTSRGEEEILVEPSAVMITDCKRL
jgi:hypothetical protein